MPPPRHRHLALADRILAVARDADLQAGDRLPEQWLADRCQVSRTPIRSALKVLADQGVVSPEPRGGMVLREVPREPLSATLSQANQEPHTPDLVGQILADHGNQWLDDAVSVADLMRRYGASRQAVQSALSVLSQARLIDRGPGQRWIFRRQVQGQEASAHSLSLRLLIEPAALLEAGYRPPALTLATIRSGLLALLTEPQDHRFDVTGAAELDYTLHETLAEACPNPFLADALAQHHRWRRHAGHVAQPSAHRLRESGREHLMIIDHVTAGRQAVAAEAMRLHLRLSVVQRPQVTNWGAPPVMQGSAGATAITVRGRD